MPLLFLQFCLPYLLLPDLLFPPIYAVMVFLYLLLQIQHFKTGDLIRAAYRFLLFFIKRLIDFPDLGQLLDLFQRILDLAAHPPILHHTFLQIFDMDILLHANVFFHKVFQPDVHLKRDRTFEQTGEFLSVQSPQINVVKLPPESFIARSVIKLIRRKRPLQIFPHFHRRQAPPVRAILVFKQTARVPEKETADLICRSLHIEHNADALFFPRIRPFQFQHDRTGKVLIPQILGFIIFADIDYTAQILDQRTVGIIGGRFVEKPSSVRIRIKYDLQCVQHRRFSASRMSGKEIDPLIQRQYFFVYIMPVVQADLRERLKRLCLLQSSFLPLFLSYRLPFPDVPVSHLPRRMSEAAPGYRLPTAPHEYSDK